MELYYFLNPLRNNQNCPCNIYCVFIQCDIMKAEKIFVCHNGRKDGIGRKIIKERGKEVVEHLLTANHRQLNGS